MCLSYADDTHIGGDAADIPCRLQNIAQGLASVGLELDPSK